MFGKLFRSQKEVKTKRTHFLSSIDLVQTPVHELVLGMYVSELDKPWLDSPFAFQGFLIESPSQLQQLRENCDFVYIDVTQQKKAVSKGAFDRKEKIPEDYAFSDTPLEKLSDFEHEIKRASLTYQETGHLVTGFMDKVAAGDGIDSQQAKEAVKECVNSVLHSPDAFLWLSQLKDSDAYTAQHSLNVCVLSIVLARQIGMTETQLNQVGLCGMMHDMGKMLVPSEILNKPGKLEPDELAIMQSHTTLGYELLKSSKGMFYGAVDTALSHHERQDGQGYPNKASASKLSIYSNIVAIADIYDAITSDRVYQKGRTHLEATKIMLDVSGSHLHNKLVVKFIESLGSYPPGCFVLLSNGCIGLVIEQNNRFKLRPKVLVVLGANGASALDEYVIDLAAKSPDVDKDALSIKEIIKPAEYNIDSQKYYQDGVIQNGFSQKK